ncbi:MAG: hypothetical protein M3490_05400, partial [Chloroflexota bacterium]|nr:hypothetical protein [Chloroflexota bacterium]
RTLFERDAQAAAGPRQSRHVHGDPRPGRPVGTVRGQPGIGLRGHLAAAPCGLRWPDPGRMSGARLRSHVAGVAAWLPPAGDRPGSDAEAAGGLCLAGPRVHGPEPPLAEVDRILLHPQRLASPQLFRNPL